WRTLAVSISYSISRPPRCNASRNEFERSCAKGGRSRRDGAQKFHAAGVYSGHASSPEAFQVRASRRTPEKEEERSQRGEARRGEAGAAIQEAVRRRAISSK